MSIRTSALLFFLLLAFPAALAAQIPSDDPALVLMGRLGVEGEKKLSKRWEAEGGVDFRIGGKVPYHEKLLVGTGIHYKPDSRWNFGTRYDFVQKREFGTDYSTFHRFTLEGTAKGKSGPWRYSLRENARVQLRYGSMNRYKHPRAEVSLATRAKLERKLSGRASVFLSGEARWLLNGASVDGYVYDPRQMRYTTPQGDIAGKKGWFFSGYDHTYLDRVRLSAGVDLGAHRAKDQVRIYALADRTRSFKIDTASSGTVLSGLWWEQSWVLGLGLRYTFVL